MSWASALPFSSRRPQVSQCNVERAKLGMVFTQKNQTLEHPQAPTLTMSISCCSPLCVAVQPRSSTLTYVPTARRLSDDGRDAPWEQLHISCSNCSPRSVIHEWARYARTHGGDSLTILWKSNRNLLSGDERKVAETECSAQASDVGRRRRASYEPSASRERTA